MTTLGRCLHRSKGKDWGWSSVEEHLPGVWKAQLQTDEIKCNKNIHMKFT